MSPELPLTLLHPQSPLGHSPPCPLQTPRCPGSFPPSPVSDKSQFDNADHSPAQGLPGLHKLGPPLTSLTWDHPPVGAAGDPDIFPVPMCPQHLAVSALHRCVHGHLTSTSYSVFGLGLNGPSSEKPSLGSPVTGSRYPVLLFCLSCQDYNSNNQLLDHVLSV